MTTPLPPTDPSATDAGLPGEAELTALYRRLPQSEPGHALDAAVLRAAAKALERAGGPPQIERRKGPREAGDWVHPKPVDGANTGPLRSIAAGTRAPPRRIPSWLIALGSAVSLVLVAGLAWHMRTTPGAGSVPVSSMAPSQAADATTPEAKRTRAMPAMVPAPAMRVAQPPPPGHELSAAPISVPVSARTPVPIAPMAAANDSAGTAASAVDSPARELTRIQQLFAQGHDDEARQRLRDFRHAHPQWPLPPALQARLPTP